MGYCGVLVFRGNEAEFRGLSRTVLGVVFYFELIFLLFLGGEIVGVRRVWGFCGY